MATPLDRFLADRHRGFHAPLDIALIILQHLETPEDIINYALSHRELLEYWIGYSEMVRERLAAAADPESNPRAFESNPSPADPGAHTSKRDARYLAVSKTIIKRLYSPTAQKCLLTAIMMPNQSDRIWDIEYRRANPSIGAPIPFMPLFQKKIDRFRTYWEADQNEGVLFSFKNLNRITPLDTASRRFAIDFMKKALSNNPPIAHHSPPTFAHPSMKLPDHQFQLAASLRDGSPVQDLTQLHETERERLLTSFYMYETLCTTSLRITGYREIQIALQAIRLNRQRKAEANALEQARQNAINAGQEPPDSLPPGTVPPVPLPSIDLWNRYRFRLSPLWTQSACQVERVRSVYIYVKMQWHLIFHALFVEWLDYVAHCSRIYLNHDIDNATFFKSQDDTYNPFRVSEPPHVFRDRRALLEQIDILCSRGLVFLHETLCLSADDRRQMLINSFYPTRWQAGLNADDYLVKGFFYRLAHHKTTLMNNDSDTSWSDNIDRALGQNYAWIRLNCRPGPQGQISVRPYALFNDDRFDILRRRGYVFWNQGRLQNHMLGTQHEMSTILRSLQESPTIFLNGPGFLDDPDPNHRGNQADLEFAVRPQSHPEMIWHRAALEFQTPQPPPGLVEFPIMGETIRIWDSLDGNGNPIIHTV